MEKLLKFSVLRYSPSPVSGEAINVGILFSEEKIGFRSFWYTGQTKRILGFDDTLSKTVLQEILGGIESEIEDEKYDSGFDIDAFVKYYINSFSFSRVQTIMYENIEKTIEDLKATFFRFDLPKSKRPDIKKDLDILSQIVLASGMKIERKKSIPGIYNERIRYDLVLDDCYIKLFDFDRENLKSYIDKAKVWAWNCNHEKKKVYIVFRYSEKDVTEKDFKVIESIFKESKCEFFRIEDSANMFKKAE